MAGLSLVPDLAQLHFTLLDGVGVALFVAATLGYHGFYALWTRLHPLATVKGKVTLYRRTWVKRIVDRDEQLLAVQSVRNLLMTTSFLASSALLVMGVILNFLLGGKEGTVPDPQLDVKLLLLVVIYGYAFFSFLLSTRSYNQFSILIGADRDLIGSVEPVDAVTFLTNILNKASDHFTMGQRAFYFSLPLVAWIVDPWAFIAVTCVLLVYLAVMLDFRRWRPPFPLRARGAEDEAAPGRGSSPPADEPAGWGEPRRGPAP